MHIRVLGAGLAGCEAALYLAGRGYAVELWEQKPLLDECKAKLVSFKQCFGHEFGIKSIGIFGSVARQENREDSDLDIVVDIDNPTLSTMYTLKTVLTEMFHCEIDLVRFRSSLPPFLKQNIEKEAIYV